MNIESPSDYRLPTNCNFYKSLLTNDNNTKIIYPYQSSHHKNFNNGYNKFLKPLTDISKSDREVGAALVTDSSTFNFMPYTKSFTIQTSIVHSVF